MKPVPVPAPAPASQDTTTPTPPPKAPVWWIFMPFELFFSLFPDITPYFSFFYFTVYKYILVFGILNMIYSYRTKQHSYISFLMVYVGIRQPAWYLFYLYALLWIGIIYLSKLVYEFPPWTLDWLAELKEMEKKGDASPTDADADKATAKPTTTKKKSNHLDKIFDDVDTDDDEDEDEGDNTK